MYINMCVYGYNSTLDVVCEYIFYMISFRRSHCVCACICYKRPGEKTHCSTCTVIFFQVIEVFRWFRELWAVFMRMPGLPPDAKFQCRNFEDRILLRERAARLQSKFQERRKETEMENAEKRVSETINWSTEVQEGETSAHAVSTHIFI